MLHRYSCKVRTKDDALITVKVMMFFELRDIETMVCALYSEINCKLVYYETAEPDD